MESIRDESRRAAIAEPDEHAAEAGVRADEEAARLERAILAFQHGDAREASFRLIFEHYYPVVLRFFRRRVFSPDDQLDLTQETFLRVYRGLEGFRREARFGTWLFRIAHNTHLKWLRRLHPDEDDAVSLPASDSEPGSWDTAEPTAIATGETALDDVLLGEQQRLLREAIGELPEQMRESTELRIYQELSYKEIAVVMRLSVETVKVHLFQARKKLKKRLKDAFEIDL